MNRKLSFAAIAAAFSAIISLASINDAYADSKIRRNTADFHAITNMAPVDVIYTHGERCEVYLEGDMKYMDKIHTEVKNGTLNIYVERGRYYNLRMSVIVSSPFIDALTVAGSGEIKVNGPIGGQGSIRIGVTGSGDIETEFIDYARIDAYVTGSGDINIVKASGDFCEFKVTGSGDIDVDSIDADEINLLVTGSGDISIHGKADVLKANVTGSGDIAGSMQVNKIETRKTGSGSIRL
ncbi:MAG: DUF2807 domain-containing protein [Bacteroidales bacterium]|nr:DUF2807 domain-containing protein [Bacteroidales bacterium]